jgi:hypothetical protein
VPVYAQKVTLVEAGLCPASFFVGCPFFTVLEKLDISVKIWLNIDENI